MPSDLELAWTAGLFDGDGCITLARTGRAFGRPVIAVDTTDPEIHAELCRLYGGSIVTKRKVREHHRQAWSWRIYGADQILDLLAKILPYMRCAIKLERGRMLLAEYRQLTPRNGFYTPEMRAQKLDFEHRFMAVGAGRGSQCRAEDEGVEPSGVTPARLSRPVAHH